MLLPRPPSSLCRRSVPATGRCKLCCKSLLDMHAGVRLPVVPDYEQLALYALCHRVLHHPQAQQVPGSPNAGAPHGFPGASPRRASEGSTASLTARCSELSSHGTPARSTGLGSSTGLSGVNIRDMVASARSPPAPDQVSCWLLSCLNGTACFTVAFKVAGRPHRTWPGWLLAAAWFTVALSRTWAAPTAFGHVGWWLCCAQRQSLLCTCLQNRTQPPLHFAG